MKHIQTTLDFLNEHGLGRSLQWAKLELEQSQIFVELDDLYENIGQEVIASAWCQFTDEYLEIHESGRIEGLIVDKSKILLDAEWINEKGESVSLRHLGGSWQLSRFKWQLFEEHCDGADYIAESLSYLAGRRRSLSLNPLSESSDKMTMDYVRFYSLDNHFFKHFCACFGGFSNHEVMV